MGSPAKSSSLQTFNMMKSVAIVALCLFAAVSAEAEADPYYGYYGHHLGYGYGHLGHGYGHGLAYAHYPVVSTIHGLTHHAYPYAYGQGYHYGKREAEPTAAAEAAPEADAYYGYGHGLAYAHYPVVSTIHGLTHHAYPYAYGHGYHYGKREAEA